MPDLVVPLDADRLDVERAIVRATSPDATVNERAMGIGVLVAAARAAEELRIAIHGCDCPAPYDQCPHGEPFIEAENRLCRERDALRAEVERLRAMEALRMAADAAMCAEIATEGAPDE